MICVDNEWGIYQYLMPTRFGVFASGSGSGAEVVADATPHPIDSAVETASVGADADSCGQRGSQIWLKQYINE